MRMVKETAPKKPHDASPKYLAAALSQKLKEIDQRTLTATRASMPYESFRQEKITALKEALTDGLNLIAVQVADGYALYYEVKRKTQVTFEWLDSGGDGYISSLGNVFSVPLRQGQLLIESFDPADYG